jgi:fatty acid desaturase
VYDLVLLFSFCVLFILDLWTVIMITYLHHTDPTLPHYRGKEWNFQRGAAATVDRPFLGWQGRFFLHDVAHYHVVHHFFPKMPFCVCFSTVKDSI